MRIVTSGLVPAFLLAATLAAAEDAKDFFSGFQIHANLAQGVLFSSSNNYLTADSSDGSFRWTDAVLSVTRPITDKLRVGGEAHSYMLGQMGQMNVRLDWAYVDYEPNHWFRIRAGKVKTPIGLYNEMQDIDAVYQWGLLPQAVYGADLRSFSLAHEGAVISGEVSLHRAGSVAYQAYGGRRSQGPNEGLGLLFSARGINPGSSSGPVEGGDVRWNTPLNGFLLGASLAVTDLQSPNAKWGPYPMPLDSRYRQQQMYAQFEKGNLGLSAEWAIDPAHSFVGALPENYIPVREWYTMASYRLNTRWTVGSYFSNYWGFMEGGRDKSNPMNYAKDTVLNARCDINRYFYLKLEGHYIHGAGQGFYLLDNPNGLQKDTKLFLARIGFTI